jgi:3-hydroxyacyl-[acyl-carrier-protein] dehydratase
MPNEIPPVDFSVLNLLKQRYPMLMVDKVLSWEKWRELKAIKNITFNEPQFQGHFPDFPIFPGVLTIECFAQSAALLIGLSRDEPLGPGLFDAIGVVMDFHLEKPIFPGDVLETHVKIVKIAGSNRMVEGKMFVNQKSVATGKIIFGEIKLPC